MTSPKLDSLQFDGISGVHSHPYSISARSGYVYLIESEYGYKIGKTVNVKSRIQLFSVKLPFSIKLISYAWFDDYTRAELNFHEQFAHKRLEGEWFDLNAADIQLIKSQGKQVPVSGL